MADFEHTLAPPHGETLTRVADDVYRLSVPVPFRGLGAVNVYLLPSPDGWTIVDTGLQTPEALTVWREARERLGITAASIAQIVLTHHHPDHIGLAGSLQAEASEAQRRTVPVWLTAREQEILDIIWTDRSERNEVMERFFADCGLPDPADVNFSPRELHAMRRTLEPFPHAFTTLDSGTSLELGGRLWQVVATPGHSDGHAALWVEDDGLFLAGDQVLPHITPNIARWPGVEPDPLGRYLASLEALSALKLGRVLPGHGQPFEQAAERLAELRAHHAERLDQMATFAQGGATVWEVAQAAFQTDRLDRHQVRMAVAETLAHLDHLVARGDLVREGGGATPWRFAAA